MYDVIIVGGGPAGLSAGLLLGRCRRKVLICDDQHYRNAFSHSMHGFLSRDGIDPSELRSLGREQLKKYQTVEIKNIKVTDAIKEKNSFLLTLETGQQIRSKTLLLATGLRDEWPKIEGAENFYGTSIFHCPYCDAWEIRDQSLVAFGKEDEKGGGLALELTLWSKDVVLCSNGPSELSKHYRDRLHKNGIRVIEERILKVEGKDGILEKIIFENGTSIKRRAIFFNTQSPQRSHLAEKLGCELDEHGGIKVGKYECTNIKDLYVAGDASREVMQAIVAASEGVEASFAINTSLIKRELK